MSFIALFKVLFCLPQPVQIAVFICRNNLLIHFEDRLRLHSGLQIMDLEWLSNRGDDLHHEDDPAVTANGALLQRHPESVHGTGTQFSNQDGATACASTQLGSVEYMIPRIPRPLPNREAAFFLDYLSDIGYNRSWKEANGDDKSILG